MISPNNLQVNQIGIRKGKIRQEVQNKMSNFVNLVPELNTQINLNLIDYLKGKLTKAYNQYNILSFFPLKDEVNISKTNEFLLSLGCNVFYADYNNQAFYNVKNKNKILMTDFYIFDLALIPGRAFSLDGARIGRGGGWYDRVIPKLSTKCIKIGVCFKFQIYSKLPQEKFDQKLDLVIST